MLNYLIVIPKYVAKVGLYYEFPLGLAYISSALKSKGFNVFCINLNHQSEPLPMAIKNAIKKNKIDAVCTGGLSTHYHDVDNVLKAVKNISPEIITIIGGGLFSSEPELILRSLGADYGVFEEGEETIVELAAMLENGKYVEGVNGLYYFDGDGQVVFTGPRKPIPDIDMISWPDYEGPDINKFLDMQTPLSAYYLYPHDNPRLIPMISTRSCPFSCTFCYHPIGKKYRARSLDNFFNELEYLINTYNVNMIGLMDELFSTEKERMFEFCKRIKQYNIKWGAQTRVSDIDRDTIHALKDSGCYYISYGLESKSDVILKSMKKHVKTIEIDKALELTQKANIGIQGNFIFGDPAETEETIQETLDWWRANIRYSINLGFIIPYPGSDDYTYAVNNGLIDKLDYIKKGCPPINLTKIPQARYKKLQRKIMHDAEKYKIFCKIISQKKMQTNEPKKDNMYVLKIRCPHCNSINIYKNMPKIYYGRYNGLVCRNCNQKFTLKGGRISFYYLLRDIILSRPELYTLIIRVRRIIKNYRK